MKRNNIIALLVVFICLFIPFSSFAVEVEGIEILEYGTGIAQIIEVKETNNVSGKVNIASTFKTMEQTDRIPARIGTEFGFTFIIKGYPNGAAVSILRKWIHPEIKNPANNKSASIDERGLKLQIGKKYPIGYRFSNDWELVSGEWTIQLLYEGKKLAEKTFYVYKP